MLILVLSTRASNVMSAAKQKQLKIKNDKLKNKKRRLQKRFKKANFPNGRKICFLKKLQKNQS